MELPLRMRLLALVHEDFAAAVYVGKCLCKKGGYEQAAPMLSDLHAETARVLGERRTAPRPAARTWLRRPWMGSHERAVATLQRAITEAARAVGSHDPGGHLQCAFSVARPP